MLKTIKGQNQTKKVILIFEERLFGSEKTNKATSKQPNIESDLYLKTIILLSIQIGQKL